MAEKTPMRRQYEEIKSRYPDCMLLFRLGDFYEMFDEDAQTAADELDLMLTTRDRNKPPEEQTPMCGVPYHAANSYIKKLIDHGHKVAVCDQLEDPALTKGLVKRDVIRVITPGTVTTGCSPNTRSRRISPSEIFSHKKNNCSALFSSIIFPCHACPISCISVLDHSILSALQVPITAH